MSNYKNRSRTIARKVYWDEHDENDYQCPDCGRSIGEIRQDVFEVHHIDGDPYNNSLENLIGLCRMCHNIREDKKPSISEIKKLRQQLGNETSQTTKQEYSKAECTAALLYHELESYTIHRPLTGTSKRSYFEMEFNDNVIEFGPIGFRNGAYRRLDRMAERLNQVAETVPEFSFAGACAYYLDKPHQIEAAKSATSFNPSVADEQINYVKQLISKQDIDVDVKEFRTWEELALIELISKIDGEVYDESVLDNPTATGPDMGFIERDSERRIFIYLCADIELEVVGEDYVTQPSDIEPVKILSGKEIMSYLENDVYRVIDAEHDYIQQCLEMPRTGYEDFEIDLRCNTDLEHFQPHAV